MTMAVSDLTRVSLRDISEAGYRSLRTHGATHGEARAGAQMVLQAELVDGTGLRVLLDDLAGPPWSHTPVEVAIADSGTARARDHLVLRSPDNAILRVAPLAVELIAGGDARVVGVPIPMTGPSRPDGKGIDVAPLDAVTLELARVCGVGIAVVACPSGRVRWARPDGSMGVGTLDALPASWGDTVVGPGLLAVRDVEPLRAAELTWVDAADRARARAVAGSAGMMVDACLWHGVHEAARGFLVPER